MPYILNRQRRVDRYNHHYTMNIYRGCSYGCKYCYATQPCAWNGLGERIQLLRNPEPKDDLIERLTMDLDKLEDLPDDEKDVQIGNTWDVYPPIEVRYELTRGVLDLFSEYPEWKVHLETKSPMITRDIDIIKEIPYFQAEITITTLHHSHIFEPQAPDILKRIEAIKKLSDNDLYVRIMIMPVLEGYTDIAEIWDYTSSFGAREFKSKRLNYFTNEDVERWVEEEQQ